MGIQQTPQLLCLNLLLVDHLPLLSDRCWAQYCGSGDNHIHYLFPIIGDCDLEYLAEKIPSVQDL